MPKLRKRRAEENRRVIETAALELFTRQGFNGTNIREIADRAGVSTGAIYTYYPSKEALFTSLVHLRQTRLNELRAEMLGAGERPFSSKGLLQLAASIRTIVYDNADYWRLMYIDVVEFDNRHFAETFQDLPEQFRQRFGEGFEAARRNKAWCGEDPGFAYASIYLHLFTYFLVEKLFRGNRHMGCPDAEAMERTVHLLCHGLWRGGEPAGAPSAPAAGRGGAKALLGTSAKEAKAAKPAGKRKSSRSAR